MNITIISKLPTPFTYTKWRDGGSMFVPEYQITINGGAGVVGGNELLSNSPLSSRSLYTPDGVATEISEETYKLLLGVSKFNEHVKRGLIIVCKGSISNQDKINDIAKKDGESEDNINGRPITAKDIEATGATINSDGSIDLTNAGNIGPNMLKKMNAGKPFYQIKAEQEEQKTKRHYTRKAK